MAAAMPSYGPGGAAPNESTLLASSPQFLSATEQTMRLFNGVHASFVAGEYEPFVLPFRILGCLPMIIYFLLPPTPQVERYARWLRWPILATSSWWAYSIATTTRVPFPGLAYVNSLGPAWSVFWFARLAIFWDARTLARRVNRRPKAQPLTSSGSQIDNLSADSTAMQSNPAAPRRRHQTLSAQSTGPPPSKNSDAHEYYWQPLPQTLRERCDWTFDLLTAFRGMGWNFQVHVLPGPPEHVSRDLDPPPARTSPKTRGYRTRSDALWAAARHCLIAYLLLDASKAVAMRDPYFIHGRVAASQTAGWAPAFVAQSPLLLHMGRLLIALIILWQALELVFSLSPLLLLGLLGERWLGYRGSADAAWMYPDFFGSLRSIPSQGLAGWWGTWWHQLFRSAFESVGQAVNEMLSLPPQSQAGRAVSVIAAFLGSGYIHAHADLGLWSPVRPISGAAAYFVLQAAGVLAEAAIQRRLKNNQVWQSLPKLVRESLTALAVVTWMCLTSPILVDDFTAGGCVLIELPFSPIRALGFGLPGDSWLCWQNALFFWYRSDRWWRSGLALG